MDTSSVISAAAWNPEKPQAKAAAESNRAIWGGWIFESETVPGYIAWFDKTHTPSDVFKHALTAGHTGKLY